MTIVGRNTTQRNTWARARTGDIRCIRTLRRKRPLLVTVRSGANMLAIFLQNGVSTEWRFYRMAFLQNGVSTEWRFYRMAFLQNGVSTEWRFYRMVFLQNGVSAEWCFYRMAFLPVTIRDRT